MKKTLYLLFTATVFTALLLGCGKETQSSTQGGGICKIRATITPPLQPGISSSTSSYNTFGYFNSFGDFNGSAETKSFSNAETQEFSVTKGQNVTITVAVSNLYDVVCRQVKVEFLIDNNVKKTEFLEMGYSKYNPTDPNNPILYCKDGTLKSLNFIVP
jgi:hypothetical protein